MNEYQNFGLNRLSPLYADKRERDRDREKTRRGRNAREEAMAAGHLKREGEKGIRVILTRYTSDTDSSLMR